MALGSQKKIMQNSPVSMCTVWCDGMMMCWLPWLLLSVITPCRSLRWTSPHCTRLSCKRTICATPLSCRTQNARSELFSSSLSPLFCQETRVFHEICLWYCCCGWPFVFFLSFFFFFFFSFFPFLMKLNLTLYRPYILESVVYDGFAFIKKGGFPYVKYGNNWHVKG